MSAMIDTEPLLGAVLEVPPCGPNLEYESDFLELEQMARGKEEKRTGDTAIPAEPPRWPEVADKAASLLRRSKDLRVACILARACLHIDGFAGFVAGIQFVVRLLQQYWDGVHPLLDAEDNDDPTARISALAPIANPLVLLRELRETALISSRQHGQILVRDVESALNKLPPRAGAVVLTPPQIESALTAAFAEDGTAVPRVGDAIAAVSALSSFLDDKLGAARAPDLKPLLACLQTLTAVVRESTPNQQQADQLPSEAGGSVASQAHANGTPTGEIRSRADALLMIDNIIKYLEANEPTNPSPMLLKRAKRFMTMSFVDIVKEIAPDSVDRLNAIAGPSETT
jgi:type VI secretion system protein ImpA